MIINNLLCELSSDQLVGILTKRLENYFFIDKADVDLIFENHNKVLELCRDCFEAVNNKYFNKGGIAYFDYCHSGQYLIYLYFFSHVFAEINHSLKDKFYYLNKIMHGVDIYSEVHLPKVFFFEHPLGLVLGRAKYGNNFFAMQGCTVGGNKGKYPVIGENVKMFSDSKILGDSIIGNNVWIAANTYIKDSIIPANSIVFGQFPNLIIKDLK